VDEQNPKERWQPGKRVRHECCSTICIRQTHRHIFLCDDRFILCYFGSSSTCRLVNYLKEDLTYLSQTSYLSSTHTSSYTSPLSLPVFFHRKSLWWVNKMASWQKQPIASFSKEAWLQLLPNQFQRQRQQRRSQPQLSRPGVSVIKLFSSSLRTLRQGELGYLPSMSFFRASLIRKGPSQVEQLYGAVLFRKVTGFTR